MLLNERLAKKQKITQENRDNLEKIYHKIEVLFKNPENSHDAVKELQNLEFELQKNWNFPLDSNFHVWWDRLPGCTCPKMDNSERFGYDKIYSSDCKWHGFDV